MACRCVRPREGGGQIQSASLCSCFSPSSRSVLRSGTQLVSNPIISLPFSAMIAVLWWVWWGWWWVDQRGGTCGRGIVLGVYITVSMHDTP